MNTYTDGFYEIEFQRAYRRQGFILSRILHLEKQRKCYTNKMAELAHMGKISKTLFARIEMTDQRLRYFTQLHDQIEGYKDEISINNPENFQRAHDAQIINAAYDRAYAPAGPATSATHVNEFFNHIFGKFVAMRQK